MKCFLKSIQILLIKDFKNLIRKPRKLLIIFIFLILSIILFYYATISWIGEIENIIWGQFWILFLFSSLIGMNAIIEIDQKNESFEGIKKSAISPIHIYLERMILVFLFLLAIAILNGLLFSFFFSINLVMNFNPFLIFTILGIASISSLISIFINIQKSENFTLYILFFILNIPQLLFGIQLSLTESSNINLLSIGISLLYFFLGIIFSEIVLKDENEK